MSIKVIMLDLDGTLLPMDQDIFVKGYFKLLAKKFAPYGYDPKQLIDTVWNGTDAMVRNNGKQSNETVFWEKFSEIYGEKALADKPEFDEFYRVEFQGAKAICGYNPKAAESVRKIKEKGMRVVLATNPIFPAVATKSRIRWAGLEPSDFELYTTYENIGYSKPNTDYYIIAEHEYQEDCVITSQEYNVLQNVKAYDPTIRTVYVMSIAYGSITRLTAADDFSVKSTNVTTSLVNQVHNTGSHLYAWTVNAEESINKMIQINVYNIITDDITLAKECVNKSKTSTVLNEYIAWLEKTF